MAPDDISDFPTGNGGYDLYREAAAFGAAPDSAAMQQQIQQSDASRRAADDTQAQDMAAARARSAAALPLASTQGVRSAGSFTAEDYTQTTHGLQALPHVQNDE